jgi:hypothetical protein
MPVASLPGPKREIGMHAQLATAGDDPAATRPARPPAAFLQNGFRPFFLGEACRAPADLKGDAHRPHRDLRAWMSAGRHVGIT